MQTTTTTMTVLMAVAAAVATFSVLATGIPRTTEPFFTDPSVDPGTPRRTVAVSRGAIRPGPTRPRG
jgi:hypothetical protein